MGKSKDKYDIKYHKDTNGSHSGSVQIKLANGKIYHLSYACAPDTKLRIAKAEIQEHFAARIPEFIEENPGAVCISWED